MDQENTIAEMDEQNNLFEQVLVRNVTPPPAPSPSPAPPVLVTGQRQADLTVSAIKVNGQVPDGKSDCKDGKSDVAVVVKNAGTARADAVAVRLSADGTEVGTQAANGLEAGKQREVHFGDVRLKKGEHTLAASVDPKETGAELQADNNTRTVTARCQDAG